MAGIEGIAVMSGTTGTAVWTDGGAVEERAGVSFDLTRGYLPAGRGEIRQAPQDAALLSGRWQFVESFNSLLGVVLE